MTGELLTRVTVWLALLGYLAGPWASIRGQRARRTSARLIYTGGLVFFLAHVAAAFHVFYDWSHAVALEETARETHEATGRRTGTGLYLNYLFTLLWIADVAWWWRARERDRAKWIDIALHGFFLFMVFNATVVFEEGLIRWLGAIATALVLGLAASRALASRRTPPPLAPN